MTRVILGVFCVLFSAYVAFAGFPLAQSCGDCVKSFQYEIVRCMESYQHADTAGTCLAIAADDLAECETRLCGCGRVFTYSDAGSFLFSVPAGQACQTHRRQLDVGDVGDGGSGYTLVLFNGSANTESEPFTVESAAVTVNGRSVEGLDSMVGVRIFTQAIELLPARNEIEITLCHQPGAAPGFVTGIVTEHRPRL